MSVWKAPAGYEARVRDSFARQKAMATMGIELVSVAPGLVTMAMPHDEALTQQHGFIHAGVIAAGMDSAAGYAAMSLMDPEAAVLTAEFKTSLLARAKGARFLFRGEVLKPGRTLSFTEGKAFAVVDGAEVLIATLTATMMALKGRAGLKH